MLKAFLRITLRGVFRCLPILAVLTIAPLAADQYHNINGFFGERAAGLGGAFVAVSDDPSGAFYNPAGLAFAANNYFSISASTYRLTTKSYVDVFGPGQGYTRKSETYLPNFIGATRDFGKYKFGFSIVNPTTEAFDQADQVFGPYGLPTIQSFQNEFTEDSTSVMGGPSIAYSLSDKMSVGATLYYFFDSTRITTSQLLTGFSGAYSQLTVHDRRRTRGFLPIIGGQYMPTDKLSLGASLRQVLVTGVNRRQSSTSAGSAATTARDVSVSLKTDNASGTGAGGSITLQSGETGAIPETTELRFGAAYFPTKYLMVTGDVIYTSGFKLEQDRTEVDVGQTAVILNDPEVPALNRQATLNFAFGAEFFLTDNLSLSVGYFTNFANSKEIDWTQSAVAAALRSSTVGNLVNGVFQTTAGGGVIGYRIPELTFPERFEHVDTRGLSLGIAWSDASSSLSLTYVIERGRGQAQIVSEQAAQTLKFEGASLYLVASTKN